MTKYIDVEPILLKVSGGWINPTAILWVETRGQDEELLSLGVVGKDKPILLKGADVTTVKEYLESRSWPQVKQEPEGFIADDEATT